MKHTPVLLKEAIDELHVFEGGKYVDATFGEGGHAKEIVKRGGLVLGIDWDDSKNRKHFVSTGIRLVIDNFANIEQIVKKNNFYPCDGILFDFGLSMNQIYGSGKGFSYKALDEPLDMRIHTKIKTKASDIINFSDTNKLYEIFSKNAEEINSWRIAENIVRRARMKKMTVVGDLVRAIREIPESTDHTFRRIFQALRMEVNNEIENIEKGFLGALRVVKSSGKIVFITFHSVEDRLIKRLIKKYKCVEVKKIRSKSGYTFERTAVLRSICATYI